MRMGASQQLSALLRQIWPSVLLVFLPMIILKLTGGGWLDLFSVGLGVVGLHLAAKSNALSISKDEALDKLRGRLHRQSGSQSFFELIEPVNALTGCIRQVDWRQTLELAITLLGKLETARELYISLLDEDAIKQLADCRSTLLIIIDSLPLNGEQVDPETLREMVRRSVVIHSALHSVSGKVKLRSDLE